MLLKIQDALDFIFEKKIIWVFFKNKNVQKQKECSWDEPEFLFQIKRGHFTCLTNYVGL